MNTVRSDKSDDGTTEHITQHYNSLPTGSLIDRTRSRIYYLRNFNNWIKSNLIASFIQRLREEMPSKQGADIRVLDLCSGKGGDLMKWRRGEVDHVVFVDIASNSVEESKHRYKDLHRRSREERRRRRSSPKIFTADFIVLDCFNTRLSDALTDCKNLILSVVSSLCIIHSHLFKQAKMMIQNAAENLRSGGYFIGTTTNAHEIVRRLKQNSKNDLEFGNEVFKIKFDTDVKETIPLFGTKYHFYLEGVVDCPEFLTYFPMVVEFAKTFGLTLIEKKDFPEYFYEHYNTPANLGLLKKMSCFEPYPSNNPMSSAEGAYTAAQLLSDEGHVAIGTLSKAEWETIGLYMTFAFRKD